MLRSIGLTLMDTSSKDFRESVGTILFLCIRTTRGDSITEGKTTMMWDRGINSSRTISFEKVNPFSRVFYIHSENIYISMIERTEKLRKKNNLPFLVHSQISDSNAVSLWYIHCFQRILLFRTYLNIFRGKLGDKTSKA